MHRVPGPGFRIDRRIRHRRRSARFRYVSRSTMQPLNRRAFRLSISRSVWIERPRKSSSWYSTTSATATGTEMMPRAASSAPLPRLADRASMGSSGRLTWATSSSNDDGCEVWCAAETAGQSHRTAGPSNARHGNPSCDHRRRAYRTLALPCHCAHGRRVSIVGSRSALRTGPSVARRIYGISD
jgi:hypothetical protein